MADDDALAGLDEQDPESMERVMRHMGNEMGEDFGQDMAEAMDSPEENDPGLDDSDGL
ncbi:MAG TPA: hypothetical protein VJL88_16845 [Nitrospira sp.]|nr:hypothetical protein [Nitrospira sp.]